MVFFGYKISQAKAVWISHSQSDSRREKLERHQSCKIQSH